MVRMIAAAALVVLSGTGMAASSAEALEAIRARLDAQPVVRAEFVQTRTIAALSKPLVTRGRLLVSRNEGVVWQIVQPYRTTYVLKQDTMVEIGADGTRVVRSERDAPAAARVTRAVRALARGSVENLSGWFETQASLSGSHWQVALTPKPGQFAQFVKSVRLSGAEFVERVAIDGSNGDETLIEFRNHRGGAISEEERRLLAAD